MALAGAAAAALAWPLAFAVFKENRLVQGVRLPAWEVLAPAQLAFLAAVSLAALLLGLLAAPQPARSLGLGALGFLLLIGVFLFSASASSRLSAGQPEAARTSFGSGAVLMLFGGYILILSALGRLREVRAARAVLVASGLALLLLVLSLADLGRFGLLMELAARRERFWAELGNHLLLSGAAVTAASLLGVPLGILAFRRRLLERLVFFLINTVQTIPSLALFGLLIVPLSALSQRVPLLRELGVRGIGWAPALLAMVLYALLPIARNTYTGLKVIPPAIPEAGAGLGMSPRQLLLRVELPLALPVLLGGIRISLVQAIGNTTVAALIGAGGLGVFVFQGLGQAVPDLILLGALPVIALAALADRLMQLLIRRITRGRGHDRA